MSDIRSKLEKLESLFKEANAPVLLRFNEGIPGSEIIAFFTENNIPIHPDLLSLYNWHNGLISIYGEFDHLTQLSPLGSFPNLNEMLALRNDFISCDYIEVGNRHEYVPILSGGEDDMHLLRVSTGEIYHSSPGIQIYCEPRFYSLSSMLDFVLNGYEKGILRMDPIEGLIINDAYWELNGDYSA
ncbi:hypothetical protein SAMN04488505_102874 [Chitinophaga rupis]|uniref:SMI1 / KNR4 family (SUKH-1) n=1 Tax=Chitinophaga rupis TaxID=573321 RepID=A0A1H7SDB2_9BACT|nr:hypothetical protein [Chitinophaga rupis]SEL69517.1 hypothetical protein SAMN04488505_102874 [Chitinophaga rupis]